MSFPKAKIQRFNDVKDLTPSPANYNVNIQDKIKLGIISQSGAFPKKPTGSCSGSDNGSVHSTSCFQTPTVPKKKTFLGLSGFKSKPSVDKEELLREKNVECYNKDIYIKDLTEQIEEMKEKISHLNEEKSLLLLENGNLRENFADFKNKQQIKHKEIQETTKELSNEMSIIKKCWQALILQTNTEIRKVTSALNIFQVFHDRTVNQHEDELFKMEEAFVQNHQAEVEDLKRELQKKIEELRKKLEDSEAKAKLLEENFKEVSLLTEMQTKEKIEEVEARWKTKLQEKEKESEAILKECQEISEYNIIQSEIEKNHFKNLLGEKEVLYEELNKKHAILEEENKRILEEITNIKIEKHAYEVSINTFKDTIEVLKKRLINSDRDVEQLKEELSKSEEKMLIYEKKMAELQDQLAEKEVANEELEMQYESTSKIMQNEVKVVEQNLLNKVQFLKEKLQEQQKDKDFLNEILANYHEQQHLVVKAQESIQQSSALIESLESHQLELEEELRSVKAKLVEEAEEASQARKKYIDISGKFDELSQRYEEITLELKSAQEKNEELQKLIGPYQEQLEAYDQELKIIMSEKETIANEAKDLTRKYADILGHQNHKQKIKHINDLKVKSTELFEKNIDLEAKNYKLNRQVDKLRKEIEELKKGGKKLKLNCEDKENLGSPKCVKGVLSPGPLRDKN